MTTTSNTGAPTLPTNPLEALRSLLAEAVEKSKGEDGIFLPESFLDKLKNSDTLDNLNRITKDYQAQDYDAAVEAVKASEFYSFLSPASKQTMSTKYLSGLLPNGQKAFDAQVGGTPLMRHTSSKEFLSMPIKAFYAAFPFVEKRSFILDIRNRRLDIFTTIPYLSDLSASDVSEEDVERFRADKTRMEELISTFNSTCHNFFASYGTYRPGPRPGDTGNGPLQYCVNILDRTYDQSQGNFLEYTENSVPTNLSGHSLISLRRRVSGFTTQVERMYPASLYRSAVVPFNKVLIEDVDAIFNLARNLTRFLKCKMAAR